ncbi:MAG: flagellar export protein FliJ [Gammaproteobacteria bacterium MedPE]|nr:MAG: flagellar export protein FliJ [Gammaproteobacteria bacterium MedPE]
MANVKQLTIVLDMAQKKEQDALKVFSQAQQQLNQLKEQMESLVQYKQDYLAQMKPENIHQVSADKLIRLQGFLAQIDQSIFQQRDVIAKASLAVDARREAWAKAKQYADSIVFLIDKQNKEAFLKEDKHQQKMADEFAMMSHHRKRQR